jgi:site-specific recombinase XerD
MSSRLQSPLAPGIARFLEHKRALGRRFDTEEWALRLFDRFLVRQQVRTVDDVTPAIVDAFLVSRPRHRPRSYNHLLGVLRRLADWLVAHGHLDRSPVRNHPRRNTAERIPFIFDAKQARQLLTLAGQLPDGRSVRLRGPTYRTIFALLYGLGLRVGEVCRLRVEDIDHKRRLLLVQKTKFAKTRLVPYGPRIDDLLLQYLSLREDLSGALTPDDPVFSVAGNRPVSRKTIGVVFRALVPKLELEVKPGLSSPRVHSLRHSFAVGTLLRWYREGIDPSARLLHLSTFLGHVNPESTAVYLTITDELLKVAGDRFENYARSLIAGVSR